MNTIYGSCILGVDYSVPPYELPDSALADSQNIVPDSFGHPVGRKGSVKLNSTSLASKVTSFHEFRSGSTANKLASYSTKVGVYSSTTGEFVDKITGLTDSAMFQWVNFRGKAIGVNGADNPQYWTDDSNNGDLAGSPPVGKSIAEWSNRLWIGGDTTNVALLTASKLNDATDFSDTGTATGGVSQTIGDSGDPITGLFGFFDILLVGKRNAIYKVGGDPATDGSSLYIKPLYTKSADSVGFTSKWAITQVGNDVLFLDGFDIKRLSGIQEFGDIETASVIPHFKDYLASIADKDYIQNTQFFHYKKEQQVWVSIPTGATTYYVFCLSYKFKDVTGRYSFYPMSGLTVSCLGGVLDGETTDIYYGDETGYVYQLDIGENDNASAIDRYFTKVFAGNTEKINVAQVYRKHFKSIDNIIVPTESTLTMTPYYAIDIMDDAQVRDGTYTALSSETVSSWAGTGSKRKRIGLFGLSGKTLAFKWRHNTVAQNFAFYQGNVDFDIKSRIDIV